MAFFEEIGKKVSQISSDTMKKTKDFSETTKLSSMISSTEKEVKELYTQIGKMYFEQNSDNPDELYLNLFSAIKEKQALVIQYNEQIKAIKGVTKCENCGAEVPSQSVFCPACGNKMPVCVTSVQENEVICPQCGAVLNDTHQFCTSCGCKLEKEEIIDTDGGEVQDAKN